MDKRSFVGWKNIREEAIPIYFSDDGVKLSDMNLTEIILCCVDGTSCNQAIPDDKSSRLLFYIKGDSGKIKEFIDAWFKGNKKYIQGKMKERVEELRKFTTGISFLKLLLDKARVRIVDQGTK